MSGAIEAQLGTAALKAAGRLAQERIDDWRYERLREQTRTVVPGRVADQLIESMSPDQVIRLDAYLGSPDFEQLTMQLLLGSARPLGSHAETILADIRQGLREGLRHAVGLEPDDLLGITDVIFDSVSIACAETFRLLDISEQAFVIATAPAQAHLAALATRNVRLLRRVGDLAGFQKAAARLRQQVGELRAELRLPHTGTSRSVPWDRLYVPPVLAADPAETWKPALDLLTEPGQRTIVLGDPGAGKSTLAARLAYRIATADGHRVPFLVVLRDLAESLRRGERTLVEHLIVVAKDPYHVELTVDAAEYLLYNGRAVVILDGLDELTDIGLRHRVVQLVNGFASGYPLVPVLVTSRRVGYADAPLATMLFRTAMITPLNPDQVQQYATNWFALDESTAPTERERLCAAFLRESASIEELRSNALLLSLLCATYASEQYLPRNRAQIYERCAVMVFERWDSMRGIAMPLRFHGQVRGAVQELAWQMFAVHDVSELTRHRVLRILVRFLEAKRYDPDEAHALAEEFLSFCTGRAWVLAEVGATDTEPIYGFAHRTFLEYFTAEYLVRRNPSAAAMWGALRPHLGDSRWTVVTQLAVQLLDRNVDDGAERLVDLALAELTDTTEPTDTTELTDAAEPTDASELTDATDQRRRTLAEFLAGTTGQVGLPPALVAPIVDAALDSARVAPLTLRHRFRVFFEDLDYTFLRQLDAPLWTVLYDSLDSNLPYVRRALLARLDAGIAAGDEIAIFLTKSLNRHPDWTDAKRRGVWEELRLQLRIDHALEFHDVGWWGAVHGWPFEDGDLLNRVFDRYGPEPFYRSVLCFGIGTYPRAVSLLVTRELGGPQPAFPTAHLLRDRLLAHPRPWIAGDKWRADWTDTWMHSAPPWEVSPVTAANWPEEGEDLATLLILCLPYLETAASGPSGYELIPQDWPARLSIARRTGGLNIPKAVDAEAALTSARLPAGCVDFLQRWVRREISVIG